MQGANTGRQTLLLHFIPFVVLCNSQKKKKKREHNMIFYSQVERLVEFRCPAVVFGFGGEFAFLVTEVWPDHRHLHKRTEHSRCLPPQIICCHH